MGAFPEQGRECFLHDTGLVTCPLPSSLGLQKLRWGWGGSGSPEALRDSG